MHINVKTPIYIHYDIAMYDTLKPQQT